jgi:hypothetical protein
VSDQAPSPDSHESTVAAADDPGLVRLMGTTPLCDVVRGRLTGRLDIRRACHHAGLPAPLRDLVLRTVRATRLWRVEKADVASELIAHCRDGLDAGRTAEEMIASFGDPALAARLIRRTKKSARPFPWKCWILAWKSLGALLVLVILGYAFLLVRLHWGAPTLSINVVGMLNARVNDILEQDRAWTRYKDAIRASTKLPSELSTPAAQWPLVPADSPFRPVALAYLEQNRVAIDHVYAAAQKPRLGCTLADHIRPEDPWHNPADTLPTWEDPSWKDNPPAIGILLPSLGEFRRFAHLFMFDSLIAREQGDGERVARNIRTTIAMAEHTRDLPFLISDLVALALMSRACEEINATVHHAPDLLTEAQLITLAHALSAFPRAGGEMIRYETEALFFEDALQRVYTDDGRGNGRVNADGIRFVQTLASTSNRSALDTIVDPVSVALVADRAETRREYDALISASIVAARTPVWTWTEAPDAALQSREQDFMWRQRYPLIHSLMFAFSRTALSQHRYTQTRDATLALIAISIAKQRTGAYPESLSELVPELLPALPLDMIDGSPLRYTIANGEPLLYSIGADRKDDGGRPPKNPYSHYASEWKSPQDIASILSSSGGRETVDGDWVLYPPLPPMPSPPPDDPDE